MAILWHTSVPCLKFEWWHDAIKKVVASKWHTTCSFCSVSNFWERNLIVSLQEGGWIFHRITVNDKAILSYCFPVDNSGQMNIPTPVVWLCRMDTYQEWHIIKAGVMDHTVSTAQISKCDSWSVNKDTLGIVYLQQNYGHSYL